MRIRNTLESCKRASREKGSGVAEAVVASSAIIVSPSPESISYCSSYISLFFAPPPLSPTPPVLITSSFQLSPSIACVLLCVLPIQANMKINQLNYLEMDAVSASFISFSTSRVVFLKRLPVYGDIYENARGRTGAKAYIPAERWLGWILILATVQKDVICDDHPHGELEFTALTRSVHMYTKRESLLGVSSPTVGRRVLSSTLGVDTDGYLDGRRL